MVKDVEMELHALAGGALGDDGRVDEPLVQVDQAVVVRTGRK